MTGEERQRLLAITRGLMLSENLGDVHDQLDALHDLLGLPRPEGGFTPGEGWTDADLDRLVEP